MIYYQRRTGVSIGLGSVLLIVAITATFIVGAFAAVIVVVALATAVFVVRDLRRSRRVINSVKTGLRCERCKRFFPSGVGAGTLIAHLSKGCDPSADQD